MTTGSPRPQFDRQRTNRDRVRAYHDRTKHHFERYAASLGYLDWENQPNPFRSFLGAERIPLDHPKLRAQPTYDALFAPRVDPAPLDRTFVSRLFYLSFALSAWKQVGDSNPWSLRVNPSSGALHPTEAYLVCGPVAGLTDEPSVFHYAPSHHALERRRTLPATAWNQLTSSLPPETLLLGLSSIYWRESWKYGERAFRYCNHDVGHAIGAAAFAARSLGWQVRMWPGITDEESNLLLGTHFQHGIEAEHADCLLAIGPGNLGPLPQPERLAFPPELLATLAASPVFGNPVPLSKQHHAWPAIDEVADATRVTTPLAGDSRPADAPPSPPDARTTPDRAAAADQIIRQRRSAVEMDGESTLGRDAFYNLLERTVPNPGHFPFTNWPWRPRVSLALFVHRVAGIDPGLYLLLRHPSHESSLRHALSPDFVWQRPLDCPSSLPLHLLVAADIRSAAKTASCHQDIAAEGAFSLGMLAQFDSALDELGAAFYPRLFWETGLIGQVLYLEAEAAGLRGTGIGCFFDDAVHDLLGIKDHSWQSLYHFTIGGPVEDRRLRTIPTYADDEGMTNA